MKNAILTLFLAAAAASYSHAQTPEEAVNYMSEMSENFKDIKKNTWKYLRVVTSGKRAKRVEKKRQKLIDEISEALKNVKKTDDFHGDGDLKTAVIDYLTLSKAVLKEDYDKILDMEEIAEQSYDMMEAYLTAQEKSSEKLNDASQNLNDAQYAFAEKYDFELVEGEDDKVAQKIKKANRAMKYYNQVYLIFFKCYKQEAYALDALSREDVNGLQQNASSLISFVDEGNSKLAETSDYDGDDELKNTASELLSFYREEAETHIPEMIDFYIKKDNLEKIKKMVESKKQKDRTQEDIDRYNEAVDAFNKAAEKFNAVNEKLNNDRSKMIDKWNAGRDDFFNKHA